MEGNYNRYRKYIVCHCSNFKYNNCNEVLHLIISKIEIKNFRSIKDEELELEGLTVLVGRNGAGKSSFLQALSCFFNTKADFSEQDYFNKQIDVPIEIRVTFTHLLPVELEEFRPYVHEQQLIVSKHISYEDTGPTARYYATRMQLPRFAEIRAIVNKNERRTKWNELVSEGTIDGLEKARNADEIEQMMQDYESRNPTLLQPVDSPLQFFGPPNIGGGKLDKYTKYVLIPAVHEVTDETVGKRGVIEQLLDLVVLRRIQGRTDIQEFRQEFERRAQEIYCSENLSELGELGDEISQDLMQFSPGSKLKLDWGPVKPIEIDPPDPILTVVEDEFEGDISHKGHGLQRALVVTLFQYLAKTDVLQRATDTAEEPENDQPPNIEGPDLLLAIEEPELYLHPSRCRYLADLLASLSNISEDSMSKIQIVFTTHSPYFVNLHHFDQVRFIRKDSTTECPTPHSTASNYSLHLAAQRLAEVTQSPPESFTRESFKARALSIMNVIVSEGFFSNVVVVVEGVSDVAALWKVQEIRNAKWAEKGIVVVPAGGKNNIDRPVVIFQGLGIPVYFIFDGDAHHEGRGDESSAISRNHRYLRLAGVQTEDFPDTQVHESWAVFNKELEETIREDIGSDLFNQIRDQAATELGYDEPSRITKNIEGISRFVEIVYEAGHTLNTLESIVHHITEMGSN